MENVLSDLTTESAVIDEDEDEEFYGNLEAPKFVDFTEPDLSQPDDGSWFCVKIGCDQNHEKIDPEALDKSFTLRVLAARSPNVRLHKALKHRDARLNAKCPHSAPAKQPRSRFNRLSTASEFPEKNANAKLKNHPISNLKSTPSQTKKTVLPKIGEKEATSTPKKQTINSKNQTASEGKSGSAFFSAKPLFSPAPKKEINEICGKFRKLNLSKPKRKSVPSRYLSHVSKGAKRCNESKLNGLNLEQKTEIGPQKIISRPLWKTKEQVLEGNAPNLGSDLCPKKESLRPTRKLRLSVLKENVESGGVENGEIGKEFDLKSKIKEVVGENDTNREQKLRLRPKKKSLRPQWKSNQPIWKRNVENGTTIGTENEEVKEESLKSKTTVNLGIAIEKEGLITELKNCEDCDENKENIIMQHGTEKVEIGKKMEAEKKKHSLRTIENVPPKQVLKVQKKPSQVNPDQGAKNKRTTNPKPFRLRTNERGILKEANLEKKRIIHLEPLKEENKTIPRRDAGTIGCKGRVIPSKIQCLNKGPTSLASKRRNAPSLLGEKKQEAIENPNSTRVCAKEPARFRTKR